MRFTGLLAALGVALILAAPAAARLILGTPGPDLLIGTPRVDRIAARGGGDRIDAAGGGRDSVSCGRGVDLAVVDAADRVGPDCESVSRRISSDPFRGGGALHATEAEPDSLSWGSKVVATFQVGRFPSGGARAIGFAVSADAGRTWRQGLLPGLTTAFPPRGAFSRASDPVVAYDDVHRLWLIGSLAFSATESALLVSSSRDGLRWSPPVTAARRTNGPNGILFDKEWIACDNWASSPFRGHCYLSYSDIEGVRLATQTSTDGGRTWSAAVGSADNAGRRGIRGRFAPGPQPVALPDGTLVVPLYDDEISVVRSTDGGASFSPAIRVAESTFSRYPDLRAAPLPSAEVGANGAIALVWPDCGRRAGCSANDLVLSTSRDGLSWTLPTVIPLGPGSHVIPGLAADPARPGKLALAYYTASDRTLQVGFVSSGDGGTTWSRSVRLSPQRMPFRRIVFSGGAMVGDYISTSFAAGRAVPVFTLAQPLLHRRFQQATYASSIPVP